MTNLNILSAFVCISLYAYSANAGVPLSISGGIVENEDTSNKGNNFAPRAILGGIVSNEDFSNIGYTDKIKNIAVQGYPAVNEDLVSSLYKVAKPGYYSSSISPYQKPYQMTFPSSYSIPQTSYQAEGIATLPGLMDEVISATGYKAMNPLYYSSMNPSFQTLPSYQPLEYQSSYSALYPTEYQTASQSSYQSLYPSVSSPSYQTIYPSTSQSSYQIQTAYQTPLYLQPCVPVPQSIYPGYYSV